MSWAILTAPIEAEGDVVAVRQRARRIAELLGFEAQDQTRIATAVSEIARNAYGYAGGGRAEFLVEPQGTPGGAVDEASGAFLVRVADRGPGIADLNAVLDGRYRSAAGLGLGITGARRLMDRFEIESAPGRGTVVTLAKTLPKQAPAVTRPLLREIAATLARERAGDPLGALREQNRELIRSMDELRERQEELARLNAELEDTNRGVVALYAELDDKAEQLRRASEAKSSFLSNMSHEFRTPLNSVLALASLLLDRADGELTPEQERQVGFIQRSALGLSELVNDLLDLAKVEAGKVDLRLGEFSVEDLFGGLRGVLRPLLTSGVVELVFEEPSGLPLLTGDESKVAQILRNFISNALKFTETGEVRVEVRLDGAGERVEFAVRDTGVGIAPWDQERIFEEFAQVDGPVQRRAKGTGLGLPLSRRLAGLLGGAVRVESEPGRGSAFFLTIPVRMGEPEPAPAATPGPARRHRLLVVDDEQAARTLTRRLAGPEAEVIEAADGAEGVRRAREERPDLIVLDLQMPAMDGFAVLRALRADEATRAIPVIVSTSAALGPHLAECLPGARAILSKNQLTGAIIAQFLLEATGLDGSASAGRDA